MGFLQHDTNNIILDAVLTDAGRQLLARNDGSFDIVKFAVADDEVNYNIIRQFGRTLGKEKIEKNTGVFEAQTNGNLALKYRCISVSNPNLIRLPRLELVGTNYNATTSILSMNRQTLTSTSLNIAQTVQNENSIDQELRDLGFLITLDYQFLQIDQESPEDVDFQRKATYLITATGQPTAIGGAQTTFTLQLKPITDAQFTVFGQKTNKNLIKTYIKVTGLQSGAVKEFEVQITK
jgi:hypothetical protein